MAAAVARRPPVRAPVVARGRRPVRCDAGKSPQHESVGAYLAEAVAEIFSTADDHGVNFAETAQPYEGGTLNDTERAKLEVLLKTAQRLAGTDETPRAAEPPEATVGPTGAAASVGKFLAEAVAEIFSAPAVPEEDIFAGTLSGWTGEHLDARERARLRRFEQTLLVTVGRRGEEDEDATPPQ